jgi:hypothetical protein
VRRTPADEKIFRERDKLIDKRSRTPVEDARLDELDKMVGNMATARNPEDQRAMDLIHSAARALCDDARKRRSDRLPQKKHRGSKNSYVTDIENLQIMLAWEAGELSEGQAAKALQVERVALRDLRRIAVNSGAALAGKLKKPRAQGG